MKFLKTIIALMTSVYFLASCNKNNTEIVQDKDIITKPSEIRDYLSSDLVKAECTSASRLENDGIPVIVGKEKIEIDDTPGFNEDNIPGHWVKTTTRYKMSQSFDETIVLDPKNDILYPGCVIKANSIADGTYAAITGVEVGPVTISIDKSATSEEESDKISTEILKNIRMSDYKKQLSRWANMNFKESAVISMQDFQTIMSKKDLEIKLGVSVNHSVASIANKFDFKSESNENKFLARFIQRTYTVTMDFPKNETIFTEVDKKLIKDFVPVYVSSISYGRMVFMSIVTKHNSTDVKNALDAVVNKVVNANLNLDAKYSKIIEESNINIVAVGGGIPEHAVVAEGLEGIKLFLSSNMELQKFSPISFTLRYAHDNSIARVVSGTEFEVTRKNFVPDFDELRLTMQVDAFKTAGINPFYFGKVKLFGNVYAETNNENIMGIITLMNKEKPSYALVEKSSDFISYDGVRKELVFKKPSDISIDEFLKTRVIFKSQLYENMDSFGDASYGSGYQEYSISEIISHLYSSNPYLTVSSSNNKYEISTRIKVISGQYFLSGKSFDIK